MNRIIHPERIFLIRRKRHFFSGCCGSSAGTCCGTYHEHSLIHLSTDFNQYHHPLQVLELTSSPSIAAFILAIYACCGGLLICCLETQLKFLRVMIAVNFGFLFQSAWRFLFYLLLASIAWSFGLLGRICGVSGENVSLFFCRRILLRWTHTHTTSSFARPQAYYFAVACFNTYVLCRYPSYRRMREKIAEEEDRRIEARISKEVKRQAARQIMK